MTDSTTVGCTGAFTCSAPLHIHGCLADWTGVRCDRPDEHPADLRRLPPASSPPAATAEMLEPDDLPIPIVDGTT